MGLSAIAPILICGLGSIGERHLRNLLNLGHKDIIVYRQRHLPSRTLEHEFPTFNKLSEALACKPALAIICNPTALHLGTAIECARAGCHLLIEKPLGDTLEGVVELERLVTTHDLRCMVAYMGRFHPCIRKIMAWLDSGRIGDIVHYRALWGDYLPDWHPYEDYRQGYAARRDLGGGPTHTLSHELDLVYAMLGMPTTVSALANRCSSLAIDTEHGMDILLGFEHGATANLHLDFFQKPPSRRMEINGTRGKITFDYQAARAELYSHDESAAVEVLDIAHAFDRNDQFTAELEYFLHCVEQGAEPRPNLADGKQVVALALNALRQAGELPA